jgi:uncharacterized SAM-binding protein YcdF (DUF218 family)
VQRESLGCNGVDLLIAILATVFAATVSLTSTHFDPATNMNLQKKDAIADQHQFASAENQITQPRGRNRRSISRFFILGTAVLALIYTAQKWAARAEVTHYWTRLSWSLFNWLTHPWWIIAPLVLAIILPLLIDISRYPAQAAKQIVSIFWGHPLSWHVWISRFAAIALLTYLFLISPALSSLMTASLTWFVPADSGAPADAIVVLSRGEEVKGQRYEIAVQLWQDQRAPQIFVTAQSNLTHMKKLLQQRQIPTQVLSGTNCAMTTYDEAQSTAAILGPQGVERIILLTDPPHMLRSLLTFRGFGFAVIPHIVSLPNDLRSAERSLLALREYPGLVSYALLGRFSWRSPSELKQPSEKMLQTIKARKCQIKPRTLD